MNPSSSSLQKTCFGYRGAVSLTLGLVFFYHHYQLTCLVERYFTFMVLKIEKRRLSSPRKGIVRSLGCLRGEPEFFGHLAGISKSNVARVMLYPLQQFPPLRHLVIPPVVAKGNQKFVSEKKHCPPGLTGSTRQSSEPQCSCSVLAAALSSGDAKRRLHSVGRPRTNVDDRLPTVRAPRAIQYGKAGGEAREREDPLPLAELTNCPKEVQSADIYDRCKARYAGLSTR
jgi:hypothetical protein